MFLMMDYLPLMLKIPDRIVFSLEYNLAVFRLSSLSAASALLSRSHLWCRGWQRWEHAITGILETLDLSQLYMIRWCTPYNKCYDGTSVKFALTKYSPYLALKGDLCDVFHQLYDEKWPRYIWSALYMTLPIPYKAIRLQHGYCSPEYKQMTLYKSVMGGRCVISFWEVEVW